MWTSISPLIWEREVVAVDVFDRVIESHGSCRSSDSSLLYFVISLAVVNISVLLLAVYQAYIARNISTEFAESEYIAKALSLILLVSFVAIPVMVIVTDDPKASFFALTSVITVLCLSVLLFIFVPKVIYSRKETRDSVRGAITNSIANKSQRISGNKSTSQLGSNSLGFSSASQTSDLDADVGEKILFHPNMREDLMNQVTTLKRRIKELESQNQREVANNDDVSIELNDVLVELNDVPVELKTEEESNKDA